MAEEDAAAVEISAKQTMVDMGGNSADIISALEQTSFLWANLCCYFSMGWMNNVHGTTGNTRTLPPAWLAKQCNAAQGPCW